MTLLSALTGDAEIEELLSDGAQLRALLAVERALAEASAEAGWLSEAAAAAVGAAVDGFAPDWAQLEAGNAQDGVVVPALVKQLRARVEEPYRAALHRGATSQDVIDTALMLQLAGVFDVYQARLVALLDRLGDLERDWAGKPLMAYTRMQVALPTSWDAKIASWAEPLKRHLRGLAAMRQSFLVVQLGGPVGDRRSFHTHGHAIAASMARRLDLGVAEPWQATRDPIVSIGNLGALIAGSLGKIGVDVTLLAQNEIGALQLEGGGESLAMPHKSNPVHAEVLVALARFSAGLSGTLAQALVHENERSGSAWTLEWLVLPQILVATGASLRLGNLLLAQLRLGESKHNSNR